MKNTTTIPHLNIKHNIDKIRVLITDINNAIKDIADRFKEVSDALGGNGQAIDELHAEMPAVGLVFWRNIALVADKKLHPLAISSGCGPIKSIARLSYSEQERALTKGVPVAIPGGDHRLVPAHLLTTSEINKAIDESGFIRSLSEQIKHEKEMQDDYERQMEKHRQSIRTIQAEEQDETSSEVIWRIIKQGKAQILKVPLIVTEKDLLEILKDIRNGK